MLAKAVRPACWLIHIALPAIVLGGGAIVGLGAAPKVLFAEEPALATQWVRVEWVLTQPMPIDLSLDAGASRIGGLRNLCFEEATTGALRRSADHRKVRFALDQPIRAGGFDACLKVGEGDRLDWAFTVAATNSEPAEAGDGRRKITGTVSLQSLASEANTIELESFGTLRITLLSGPVQVELPQRGGVFWTGEAVPLTVRVRPPGKLEDGEQVELEIATVSTRDQVVVARREVAPESVTGPGGWITIDAGDWALPEVEGAYTVRVMARVRDRGRRRLPLIGDQPMLREGLDRLRPARWFGGEPPKLVGAQEIVVVSSEAESHEGAAFRTIGTIDPLRRTWSIPNFLPQVTGVLPLPPEPTSSKPIGEVAYGGRKIAVIEPGGWYACPLPTIAPEMPHLAIVRYPEGVPVQLGISVVQRDAAGEERPIGADTGIVGSTKLVEDGEQRFVERRLLFWPHDQQPYLVLSNHDPSRPAPFASIRVEAGPRTLPTDAAAGGDAVADDASGGTRLAALSLDKPLLVACFGDAGRVVSVPGLSSSTLAVDDWQSWLVAARRLARYLKWAGYNGVMLPAHADGAALFGTELYASTPRYARHLLLGDAVQTPDVLELVLRVLDREGLRCVPTLEPSMPTRRLEALRERDRPAGLRPSDALGRSATAVVEETARRPSGNEVPRYNVLHPEVQREMQLLCGELIERYGQHRSFAGVGVRLEGGSYAQAPMADLCLDEATLQRFAAGCDDPSLVSYNWVCGEGSATFARWRAEQLTAMYARMSRQLGARRLVLIANDAALAGSGGLAFGVDWRMLGQVDGIVPLRLIRERLFDEVVKQASVAKLNGLRRWDRTLAEAKQAGILVHRPPARALSAVGNKNAMLPDGAARSRWRFQVLPSDRRYRFQMSRSMAAFDPQVIAIGGEAVPWGGESAGAGNLRVFGKLPATVMEPLPSPYAETSRVVVKRVVIGDQGYVSAVNLAPWPMRVEVDFGRPVALTSLGTADPEGVAAAEEPKSRVWRTTLQAGQLRAIRVDGAGEAPAWRAEPAEDAEFMNRLAKRVQSLATRVAMLTEPRRYPGLRNGDFSEQPPMGKGIPGWMHSQHPPGSVTKTSPSNGDHSAVIMRNRAGEDARAWLVSAPIAPPATGRLAVSLQARCLVETPSTTPPELRLAIEGRDGGRPIRHRMVLRLRADGDWQEAPLWLEVEEIGGSEIEDLRLTIDWLSDGEVMIDEVRLYDFFLTPAERSELQSRAFLAVQRMRKGDLSAAARLFDSHWAQYLMRLPPVPTGNETAGVEVPAVSVLIDAPENPGIAERLRGWLPGPLRF